MKYLRTLEDWFDKLNDDGDFPKLLEVRGTLRDVTDVCHDATKAMNAEVPCQNVIIAKCTGRHVCFMVTPSSLSEHKLVS